jgi:hypothetical protein
MVARKRWSRDLKSFDDLLEFERHLDNQMTNIPRMADREFPGSVKVSGSAYVVIKERIVENKRSQRNFFIKALASLFGGPQAIAKTFVMELGRDFWKLHENKKGTVVRAAMTIAAHYSMIESDDGSSMKICYVFETDNGFEQGPNYY